MLNQELTTTSYALRIASELIARQPGLNRMGLTATQMEAELLQKAKAADYLTAVEAIASDPEPITWKQPRVEPSWLKRE